MSKFGKALAAALRVVEEEKGFREPNGFWFPSQLGQCDRRNVLKHAGVPENPFDDRTLRLFWLGDRIHKALQENFPFEVVGHELSVKDEEYKLSGRIDTLCIIDGILEVIEFKSIQSKKFSYGQLPDDKHVMQIACYLTFPTTLETGEFVLPERGRIVYWSKDDARIDEYLVTPDDALKNRVKEELKRMESLYEKYKESGEVPFGFTKDGKTELPAWYPRYCGYYGTGKCCGDKVPEAQSGDVGSSEVHQSSD